jgi:Flp pilus assembly protein CpaB
MDDERRPGVANIATGGRVAGVLRPARGLPSGRAVVGGLLVAVALIGTWWAASGGRSDSADRYLVAARRIGPGQEVGRADLAWMTGDLPARLRTRAFTDPHSVLGHVTTAPLEAGDLVQASSVVRAPGAPGSRELSFVVDTDWAVGGTLRPGDRIDLLVTYGDGAESQTRRVLADTVVRRVSDPGGDSLGSTRTQSITVALDDDDLVREATNATRAGTVTVVRSTGVRSEPRREQTTTTRPTRAKPPTTTGPTATIRPTTTAPTTTAPAILFAPPITTAPPPVELAVPPAAVGP